MKSDPLKAHQEAMLALQHEFGRKISYHRQKAYHDPADIYWLAHEFLGALLQRVDSHHTEEELSGQLKRLKHDFISIPTEIIEGWQVFLTQLAFAQYGGVNTTPEQARLLLDECATLIEETLREVVSAPDELTKQLQALKVLVKNGEFEKAEEHYRKLITHYERLPDDKKHLHYHRVSAAYNAILDGRSAQPVSHQ